MIPFPDKKYNIIYADPPWSYSDKGCNGNAASHYQTMKIDDICNLPVNTSGGGYCCRRLRPVLMDDLPNDEGSPQTDRGVGLYIQVHRLPMGEAEPQRKRLFFRTRPVDSRKYRALPHSSQRKAEKDQRERQSARILPAAQALRETRRGA